MTTLPLELCHTRSLQVQVSEVWVGLSLPLGQLAPRLDDSCSVRYSSCFAPWKEPCQEELLKRLLTSIGHAKKCSPRGSKFLRAGQTKAAESRFKNFFTYGNPQTQACHKSSRFLSPRYQRLPGDSEARTLGLGSSTVRYSATKACDSGVDASYSMVQEPWQPWLRGRFRACVGGKSRRKSTSFRFRQGP